MVVLLLLFIAAACIFAASFGAAIGRVHLGWLGVGLGFIAAIVERWPG